ncbi:MAG: methyltransferase family protein [Promethearchaeota archaeon]
MDMQIFPPLQITWFGGWLLLLWLSLMVGLVLIFAPKNVRTRLLDRSKFTKSQKIFLIISKLFSLITLVLICLTPLTIGSVEFIIGIILFMLAIIGFVIAVINYVKTPLDEPVTRGIYKISRHPQETMLSFAILGACFAVSSWFILILFAVSRIFFHFRIVAEEQACLQQYGESYQEYLNKVPRYFLIF